MSEVVIRASFYIYCRRNKTWTNPEYLKYIWKSQDAIVRWTFQKWTVLHLL
jgi:hypothetical protein